MTPIPFQKLRPLIRRVTLSCVLSVALASHQAMCQNPFEDSPLGTTFGDNTAAGDTNPFGMPSAGGTAADAPAFGGFGQPMNAQPTEAATSLDQEDPDPIVRRLRSEVPQTPQDMADGLTWMVRLKRWDEVRRLLDVLNAANWPLEQQAALTRSAGSSLWLRVRSDDAQLSPEQSKLVGELLAAPAKLARQPAWLDSWINKLASPSAGERRLAQLRLQDGSMVAVARLVEHLMAGDTQVEPAILAATVMEFGRDGSDALRAACLVADPQRAGRVVLALAELPGREFSAEIGAGLASRVLPADVQSQLAEVVVRRFGKLPSSEAIRAYLDKQFSDQLAQYQQTRATRASTFDIVWRLTPDRRSIQLVDTLTKDRWLENAARLAAHRLQLSPPPANAELVDCGAVLLQRAYQVQPTLALGEVASAMLLDIPKENSTEPGFWVQIFEQASEWQMHGGAVRALQMLVASAGSDYLIPTDFLSRLLSDSRPVVRYAALESIAAIDPQSRFEGSEKALETALEMTELADGPHALVIGLQSELRAAAGQQITQQTGGGVTLANSARTALLALNGNAPVELLVVVDRVADQSLYEMFQRLRKSERGRALPLAVLTDELYQHERQWIAETPGVVHSVLSNQPQHMSRILDLLADSLDTAPLTASDREHFALVASRFLTRIAGDRDTYAFYPLSDWREELLDLGSNMSTRTQLAILAGLGTADSQRKLTELAASSGLDADERLQAAQAFGKSVRRFGLNISSDDVQRTYDLYNTLGPSDPNAVKSLGLALDIVEAQAGKGAWPDGL